MNDIELSKCIVTTAPSGDTPRGVGIGLSVIYDDKDKDEDKDKDKQHGIQRSKVKRREEHNLTRYDTGWSKNQWKS